MSDITIIDRLDKLKSTVEEKYCKIQELTNNFNNLVQEEESLVKLMPCELKVSSLSLEYANLINEISKVKVEQRQKRKLINLYSFEVEKLNEEVTEDINFLEKFMRRIRMIILNLKFASSNIFETFARIRERLEMFAEDFYSQITNKYNNCSLIQDIELRINDLEKRIKAKKLERQEVDNEYNEIEKQYQLLNKK